MKNIVFLDFDGVLFDTAAESYYIIKMMNNEVIDIDKFQDTLEYKIFLSKRYLVETAWNYYLIVELLKEKLSIEEFEIEYNRLKKIDNNAYSDFERLFFDTRRKIVDKNFNLWIKLHKPYSFLEGVVQEFSNYINEFYIVSTKNKDIIVKLLETYRIDIPAENIFGNDDYKKFGNKSRLISEIIKIENAKNAIFIDDIKEHLNKCKEIDNMKLYQADWGYKNPKEKGTNEKEMMKILREFFKTI